MADVDSIEEIYDNVCQIKYLNVDIKPLQVRKEILALLQKVKDIKPKIIVEIGTNKGGTLALYTNVSQSDTKLISLDLPSGQFGGGYPEWKIPLYKSFARENQQIKLIRADSHELESLEILKNELNGQEIDFLFIDGDHTYEGIKQDFEMYSPLVRSKGMIAFHDIVVHENIDEVNVFQFWNEIKENYEYIENVEDWDQKSCGIGIIIKP
ncbi:class I SAM-dependent methyltransferase [Candidatus Lokiarchaeum ossiferum]